MSPSYDAVETGHELPALTLRLTRADLIRYAGASLDFNPIHYSDRVARAVGLPDVIAHGMLTMGCAGRVVTDWVGDPGAVREYGVRFTRPVVVPDDDDGADLHVTAKITEKLDDRCVRIAITAVHGGATVLGRASALVRLPA